MSKRQKERKRQKPANEKKLDSADIVRDGRLTDQIPLLAKDFADNGRDLFSSPRSLRTFGQFRTVLGFSEFPQECRNAAAFWSGRLFERCDSGQSTISRGLPKFKEDEPTLRTRSHGFSEALITLEHSLRPGQSARSADSRPAAVCGIGKVPDRS
jgi:hypothetical protein